MGSASSTMIEESPPSGLGDLPEGCVALVLINLHPEEICQMASLNWAFRGAANADLVWETKLPANYLYLMETAGIVDADVSVKKEIYARLCRPNPFDGGSKVFWLDKSRGGICMAISTKALEITGVDDRRYWSHIPSEESRFKSVAYLQQTWWFEVNGNLEFWFPVGAYSIFIRLQLGRPSKMLGWRTCDCEHVHGWEKKPVTFQLSTSNGQHSLTERYLGEPRGWINYHVGDFIVNDSSIPIKIKFSMMQIDCTHTKGGISIDSALVFPKKF